MYEKFRDFGRDLFLRGLISSHGGNMSVRQGDKILITRHGAMLGRLAESDLMLLSLDKEASSSNGATGSNMTPSFDLAAHRAVYQSTDAKAILHAHPPHALALSMLEDDIVLVELEASYLLKRIPVLKFRGMEHYTEDSQTAIPAALKNNLITVVRGHGSYAAGATLEDAYRWTSTLEENCRIVHLMGSARPR